MVQPGEHDVVALTERTVRPDEDLRHDEQREALRADRSARDLRQHQVDDVLAQLVLAARDPHLVPGDAVGPVLGGHRSGGDVGQRRTGLRFGQAHRPEEPSGEHRPDEAVDLVGGAVGQHQVGVGRRQERVGGRADVGGLEPREARLRHDGRQLHPPDLVVHGSAEQVRLREDLQRRADLVDDVHAGAVERGLLGVALLVVGREVAGGYLLAQVERRREGVAAVVGVALPGEQRLGVQPLEEQEVQITTREQERGHTGHPASAPR